MKSSKSCRFRRVLSISSHSFFFFCISCHNLDPPSRPTPPLTFRSLFSLRGFSIGAPCTYNAPHVRLLPYLFVPLFVSSRKVRFPRENVTILLFLMQDPRPATFAPPFPFPAGLYSFKSKGALIVRSRTTPFPCRIFFFSHDRRPLFHDLFPFFPPFIFFFRLDTPILETDMIRSPSPRKCSPLNTFSRIPFPDSDIPPGAFLSCQRSLASVLRAPLLVPQPHRPRPPPEFPFVNLFHGPKNSSCAEFRPASPQLFFFPGPGLGPLVPPPLELGSINPPPILRSFLPFLAFGIPLRTLKAR